MNLCSKLEKFGFFPYQKKWLADQSRFKIGLWARQTGKDFCAAAEAVVDSIINPKTTWIVLAAGERQALESIAKAKDWARAFGLALDFFQEDHDERLRPACKQPAAKVSKDSALLSQAEIRWANGSRFIALPARPETVRGYSANLILTEFAFHEDPYRLSGYQLCYARSRAIF